MVKSGMSENVYGIAVTPRLFDVSVMSSILTTFRSSSLKKGKFAPRPVLKASLTTGLSTLTTASLQ
jgi:hypothetical protein